MKLSIIVAMDQNHVIGRAGALPWKLSADLKRFKSLTMGHHLIMGRKTFESLPRLLPGRTSLVISRSQEDIKLSAWYWYHCYRSSLPKEHPDVFTPSNEAKAEKSDWLNVILSLGSNGPFGDYNQICGMQVHLVLKELNRIAVINKELKAHYGIK